MNNQEIKNIMFIYIILMLSFWIVLDKYKHNHKLKQMYQEQIELKKVVIDLYNENESYRIMVQSLNDYADEYDNYRSHIENNERLLKDLVSIDSNNKAIVLAIAFTESSLNYNVNHKEKWTTGIGGVRPNFYPDLFKGKLNPNSLVAIEKVYLFLMNKFDNDKIAVLKHYKGIKSDSNMYLVYEVIELENKLKQINK